MVARQHLVNLIQDRGVMGLGPFMRYVLYHPDYGYYQTKNPFGKEGDYITSSEISQVFGELIALWFYDVWNQFGCPSNVHFVEVGPGKGTFMRDFIRTSKKLKGFLPALSFHLIEVSSALQIQQKETLKGEDVSIDWHQNIQTVPNGFTFIFGNEFFDAFPIEQYMKTENGWKRRMVRLCNEKGFSFTWVEDSIPLKMDVQEGAIVEICADGEGVAREIAARLREQEGVGLFVDYGYQTSSFQDSLQAIKSHRYTPVLSNLGEADLTHHVNFKALSEAFALMGVTVFKAISQRDLLISLGIEARTQSLLKKATSSQQQMLLTGSARLIGAQHMGELFKAIAISSKQDLKPIGFYHDSSS